MGPSFNSLIHAVNVHLPRFVFGSEEKVHTFIQTLNEGVHNVLYSETALRDTVTMHALQSGITAI